VSQALRDAVVPMQHPEIQFDDVFPITVKGKREALSVCQVKRPE